MCFLYLWCGFHKYRMAHPIKTRYRPTNPKKYSGNAANIVCRSSWERTVCRYLDLSPSVLWWSSEELAVPYMNPLDGCTHRYFPDFVARIMSKNGGEKTIMIEVKPDAQTRAPAKPTRKSRRFLREMATYAVNMSKWEAAREFCIQQGWEFLVLTETMAKL